MPTSKIEEIKKENVSDGEKIKGTIKQVLTTEDAGISNIKMRYFTVEPGGHTPWHKHDWEHENYFVQGKGILITEEEKTEVHSGMSGYVEANELHQFKNPYDEPFEFICLIPVTED